MGTNFYCREKISKKSRTQIQSLLDDLSKRIENADESADIANMYDSCKESIEEYIPEEIHLGKRSCGWQFLWDYHNGKYYEANLESIIVAPNSTNFYTLEWYWEDNDRQDTIIGSLSYAEYKLRVKVGAQIYDKLLGENYKSFK